MIDPITWRARCVVAYLDEPPYFMPVTGEEPVGSDIELTKMILDHLGVKEVKFVLTTFGDLIDGVRSGRWHINTPMFITPERSELVIYSRPVWAATDSFIVRSDDSRDFSSYEAIAADKTIRLAAVSGQIQLDTALKTGVEDDRIIRFADQDSAAAAVASKDVDASVSTAPGNHAYLQRLGDVSLVTSDDVRAVERGGVALGAFSFGQGSVQLASSFDEALSEILGTRAHLEMMGRHGFTLDALQPALSAAEVGPFRQLGA